MWSPGCNYFNYSEVIIWSCFLDENIRTSNLLNANGCHVGWGWHWQTDTGESNTDRSSGGSGGWVRPGWQSGKSEPVDSEEPGWSPEDSGKSFSSELVSCSLSQYRISCCCKHLGKKRYIQTTNADQQYKWDMDTSIYSKFPNTNKLNIVYQQFTEQSCPSNHRSFTVSHQSLVFTRLSSI